MIKKEAKEFVNQGKEGKLIIGCISEYILLSFIKENEEIQKYISWNFERIIIDEAQDLSILRYYILIEMHLKMKINITLVGDEKQTIYSYLGAKEKIFQWLREKYKKIIHFDNINLNKNFRYISSSDVDNVNIKNILSTQHEDDFKESIRQSISNNEIIILGINDLKLFLNSNQNSSFLFLTKTNLNVQNISDKLNVINIKHRTILKLPQEIKISFEEQIFIENLFLYFSLKKRSFNWRDIKSNNIVDELCDFIWPFDPKKNEKFLELFWNNENSFDDVINKVIILTNINVIKQVIELYKINQNYISNLSQEKIQVMTFHGSKGLEADNIFLNKIDVDNYLKSSNFNSPSFQEMFVGLSRVKKKIFLLKLY